jgi:hypothetical protein
MTALDTVLPFKAMRLLIPAGILPDQVALPHRIRQQSFSSNSRISTVFILPILLYIHQKLCDHSIADVVSFIKAGPVDLRPYGKNIEF